MGKNVYVSADWKAAFNENSCDKTVVDRIRKWKDDPRYGVTVTCTDDVHNSVVNRPDCRRCDIKIECGRRIDRSSVIIFVVGDNTGTKSAGKCEGFSCAPAYSGGYSKMCKFPSELGQVSNWKAMSYLQYEITTAVHKHKKILIVYNSVYHQYSWIPGWYKTLLNSCDVNELDRIPFWKDSDHNSDRYQDIKKYLQ